jgi:riboflavin synthase
MFTGIILKMGKYISLERKTSPTLTIDAGELANVKIGDSVAVNGACLTVVEIAGNLYKFNLSQETLRLANFGDLTRGSYVNIELPLTMQDFLGGHLVSGHLEGVARVKAINAGPGGAKFSFVYRDRQWKKFLIHKGSVTINGVSLTISELKSSYFSVEIIPHTLEATNLKYLKIGERVNLELDMLAKYLHNLIHP